MTQTNNDNSKILPEEVIPQQESLDTSSETTETEELLEPSEEQIDPILAFQLENADLKDKLLRALAETENTRRRSAKDVADARVYGITGFARDMLTVVDNLRRAIEALPLEASLPDHPLKGFLDGINLTERDLINTLERHGVRKLDPQGERFDPNFHQAVFEMPDPATPVGHIAVVVQPGFVINDRILRPVMVGVSKGGGQTSVPDCSVNQSPEIEDES